MLSQYRKNIPNFSDFAATMTEKLFSGDSSILSSIIDDLAPYDIFDFIARVSSLNLMIENQNKSTILDALVAGILSRPRDCYQGKAKMSSGKFRNIINRLESMGMKQLVDPAENAFIERVRYYGNYWIFPGINYAPAHTLQGFLNVLYLRGLQFNDAFTNKARQLVNCVLHISDVTAHILGYGLETLDHVEQAFVKLPDSKQSELLKNCVYLRHALIEELIDDPQLRQCLFIDFEEKELSQVITGEFQEFFAHPFLNVDDETILLLNPSVLVPFLVHQIILLADSYGEKCHLIDAYNNEIWQACKNDLRELGHKKILESEYGIELINNQHRKEIIMTVGNNKLLFVHFVCDAGGDYNTKSMFGQHMIAADIPAIHDRVKYFIDKLPMAEKDNIYQLVILNTFGRTIGCETTAAEAHYSIPLSPFELHCVAVNEHGRDEFIPRYINAKRKLTLMLPPTTVSELNSIEIYTSSDYSFYLSDDYDPKVMSTFFAPGDSLDYVLRAVKKEDRHLTSFYDGVHLSDVVLNDPVRNIYFTKSAGKTPPVLLVKFNDVNIWLTVGDLTSGEKADVLYSIIDTISYWLAEAKEIVNWMTFRSDAIRINVDLSAPIDQYYHMIQNRGDFLSGIEYSSFGNTLNMIWHPEAYQLLGERTNNTEKILIKSIFEELAQLNQTEACLELLDALFANPLKTKVYEINSANTPYMIPTGGLVHAISAEEEHQLLDEIGSYFLSLPEYDYGRVPDEKRAKLTNQIVRYLYTLLQKEIASINPVGIYEKVCYDLETVMYDVMLAHSRYAYEIACYPEKASRYIEKYNEANKASLALKFLAEYIAAVPPCGTQFLGTMQYDRILAICSLIIDWAYKNDLFFYNIFNTPVEFLKSGRIGMARAEGDFLSKINAAARTRRIESLSDPRISVYKPSKPFADFQEFIDDAFEDEYGFTYEQFARCILAIADYGDSIETDVKRAPRSLLVQNIVQETSLSEESANKIIQLISLGERDDFLTPPKPFRKEDVYPWRFNRELSFTRRPIIQYKDELIWGNRQLHHMLRYTVDLIMEGKYKARHQKLKTLVGKLSDIRGNEFNTAVYQKLRSIDGLIVRERLSKINGKKIADENGNVLGDIDVFYIVPEKRKIVVGEVKDFSFAKSPYEMDQEYKRIFVDGDKPCYMTKHKRRVNWVKNHIEDVKIHFDLPDGKWSVRAAMFVSDDIVSNAFYHQQETIIVYSQIAEKNVKSV